MNDYSITHEERIGDLVYSYRTYKLTGPKGSITLTRGCGDLLEFFIENRNIPYAAEDIYEILEEKSSDDPRMAGRQRICTLRRFMEKVGSKKGDEYIKTEKRVGYYIE
jgi:DNA-binding response OmpR family regulator